MSALSAPSRTNQRRRPNFSVCCDRAADRYVAYLESAGLRVDQIENHDEILNQTAIDLQGKLLGAELLVKLNKINLPGIDLRQARRVARDASKAIHDGKLGYTLIVASSPAG